MSGDAAPGSFEAALGHAFRDPGRLREALTHRSSLAEAPGSRARGAHSSPRTARRGGSNERLEFIGDRVLGLLVAEWLLERFPGEQEGALGRRHAQLVSRDALAAVAETMGLAEALQLSPDALRAGVGARANVVADALEAVLGAVFLDGGLEPARAVVRAQWARLLDAQANPPVDAKTALQEWLLARARGLPHYVTVAATGPSHDPRFAVEARTEGGTDAAPVGRGEAGGKREAERLAAADLLAQLKGTRLS